MKNKEKYANELVACAVNSRYFAVKKSGEVVLCVSIRCEDCIFRSGSEFCIDQRKKWANAEAKVSKFTEREKKFIWLNWDCNYVQRTLHGQLWFYSKRPRSNESISGLLFAYPQKILDFLNIPFEGIKEGETVSREEILREWENEEDCFNGMER